MSSSDTRIIKEILKQLGKVDLENIDINYLRSKAKLLIAKRIKTDPIFPPGWGRVHRSIRYSQKPTKVSELGYPPPTIGGEPIPMNRANLKGCPVFYCAGLPQATLFEMSSPLKPGDTFVMSKWEFINPVHISLLGYQLPTFKRLNTKRKLPNVVPFVYKPAEENSEINEMLNRFLDEHFTRIVDESNNYCYKLTASIAHELYFKPIKDIRYDLSINSGIAYPAIAMKGETENFAFPPKVVDRDLRLVKARWFVVDEYDPSEPKYKARVLSVAYNFDGGIIRWQQPSQEDLQYLA